jgi:hypothetical protein
MASEAEFNAETPSHYHFYAARIPDLAFGFVITPRFTMHMDDASRAYAVLDHNDWYEEGEGFFQYRDGRSAQLALTAFDHLIALGMVENPALADAMGEFAGRVTRQQIQEAANQGAVEGGGEVAEEQ